MINNRVKRFFIKAFFLIGLLATGFFTYFFYISDNAEIIRKSVIPTSEKVLGVSSDYSGFVANSFDDIFNVIFRGLKYRFTLHSYPKVDLMLDLNAMKKIELLRENKINDKLVKGKIKLYKNGSSELFKVKVRPKGDRDLHRLSFNQMSFKADIKGKERLLGLEEFSIQHPIIRNYGWELLINRYARELGIIAPSYIPVDFSVNGNSRGIYILEEGFTKELLEKNKRKNGPIFSVDEEFGLIFPDVIYKVHSRKKILKNSSSHYALAVKKLSLLKSKYKDENFDIASVFDLKSWAKYFAVIDLFQAYHGAVPKSVKLYYNPSTSKFEPIFYDGHVGGANYRNFIFHDIVTTENLTYKKCGYACTQPEWFRVFFDKKNTNFLQLYKESLAYVSSEESLNLIQKIIDGEVEMFNNSMYSTFSPSDRVFIKGILPYYFDKEHLEYRVRLINSKLDNSVIIGHRDKSNIILNTCVEQKDVNCRKNQLNKIINYFGKNIVNLESNDNNDLSLAAANYLAKDYKKKSGSITLDEGTVLIFIGDTELHNLQINGKGMLVQLGGSISIKNFRANNLKNIYVPGVNWSAAINIINSNAYLEDLSLFNTLGEDSINIVSSNTSTKGSVSFFNIESDGLDVDFGKIDISTLNCNNIGNDCVDLSGALGTIGSINGRNIGDKMISIGEGSHIYTNMVSSINTGIGVAVKDSSVAHIEFFEAENTPLHFSVFNKKPYFSESSLTIGSLINIDLNEIKYLISKGNYLKVSDNLIEGKLSTFEVKNQMYGRKYGRNTIKR
jgi:hypothetical protein